MNCIVCNRDQDECLDYGIYERGGKSAMVCTTHQPISTLGSNKGLERTTGLRLLKDALGLTWEQVAPVPKKVSP